MVVAKEKRGDLALVGGSDAHTYPPIASVFTMAPGKTWKEFLASVRRGECLSWGTEMGFTKVLGDVYRSIGKHYRQVPDLRNPEYTPREKAQHLFFSLMSVPIFASRRPRGRLQPELRQAGRPLEEPDEALPRRRASPARGRGDEAARGRRPPRRRPHERRRAGSSAPSSGPSRPAAGRSRSSRRTRTSGPASPSTRPRPPRSGAAAAARASPPSSPTRPTSSTSRLPTPSSAPAPSRPSSTRSSAATRTASRSSSSTPAPTAATARRRGSTGSPAASTRRRRRRPPRATTVLLETAAGQGACLGHDFAHLAAILARADSRPRLALCFDTCHVHAAGYDVVSKDGWRGDARRPRRRLRPRPREGHPRERLEEGAGLPRRPPRADRPRRDRREGLREPDDRARLRRRPEDPRDPEGRGGPLGPRGPRRAEEARAAEGGTA